MLFISDFFIKIPQKRGEGTRQRTCTNDPWTWTTVRGLPVGVGLGWAEEDKGGKIGTTVI